MRSTLVSWAGTFTDAACRLETSETSLLPRASHTGQCVLVWMFLVVAVAESVTAVCWLTPPPLPGRGAPRRPGRRRWWSRRPSRPGR